MTDLSHVSFIVEICRSAQQLGRTPAPEQIEALDQALKLAVQIDHEGRPVVVIEPVGDFIGRHVAAFPKMESAPTSTTLPAGAKGALDRIEADADAGILRVGSGVQQGRPRGDPFADIVRGLEARHQVALAAEASGWPNPWLESQINRTRQTILSKTDPARAARMKAEAGA
ncbi:hypothetical protein [Methylorubrum extorquens]